MDHHCSFCGTEAPDSQLVAMLNGTPQSRICANCYFIATDLGYSVISVDVDALPALVI